MTDETIVLELGAPPAAVPLHITTREWPMLDNEPWTDGRQDPDMPIPYTLAEACPG